MKFFYHFLFITVFFVVHSFLYAADLKLPAVLSDHMVLQQNSEVQLWGTSGIGERLKVTTSWNRQEYYTNASSTGNWKLSVSTPSAGGPYEIEVMADSTIVLKDVLIGEVWVCSGQSNMEMPLKGYTSQPVLGSNDAIARSANDQIRYFNVERNASLTEKTDCEGAWKTTNPENSPDFSAVAYFFGKYLNNVLDVPVGLIHASWQGSPIDTWVNKTTLKEYTDSLELVALDTQPINRRTPTALFNGMIHPLINYTIKGVVWYQGESDKCDPAIYEKLFPALINSWRTLWGQEDFPFYYVQIAPFQFKGDCNVAWLREVQLKSMNIVDNTGMVVTMDIGSKDTVHPPDKETVGNRLAYWALSKTYGIGGINYCGPVFRSMNITGDVVELSFDYAEMGFTSFGKVLNGFEIAGKDKVFHPGTATINRKKNCVEVTSEFVNRPVEVRYCWQNYIEGTLFNTSGLPASPFRTDQWPE